MKHLRILNKGVSDDDIAKFKSSYESSAINGLASVSGKVTQLAAYQTFTGNPNMLSEELKRYRNLTKADVMRVYNKYMKNKNRLVVSVLTQGKENLIAAADNYIIDSAKYTTVDHGYNGLKYVKAKDNFNRKPMPGNGPNPVVKVPAFYKKALANGMKVIGTENTEIPVVTLAGLFKRWKINRSKRCFAGWAYQPVCQYDGGGYKKLYQ